MGNILLPIRSFGKIIEKRVARFKTIVIEFN